MKTMYFLVKFLLLLCSAIAWYSSLNLFKIHGSFAFIDAFSFDKAFILFFSNIVLVQTCTIVFGSNLNQFVRARVLKTSKSYQLAKTQIYRIIALFFSAFLLLGVCNTSQDIENWVYIKMVVLFIAIMMLADKLSIEKLDTKAFMQQLKDLEQAKILIFSLTPPQALNKENTLKYQTIIQDISEFYAKYYNINIATIGQEQILLHPIGASILNQSISLSLENDTKTHFNSTHLAKLVLETDFNLCVEEADQNETLEHFQTQIKTLFSDKENKEVFANFALGLGTQPYARYIFKGDCTYVPYKMLHHFNACQSCGTLIMDDKNYEGEFYCSKTCENVEKVCEKISNTLNPILEPNQSLEAYNQMIQSNTQQNLNKTNELLSAISINSIVVPSNWVELYKPLSNTITGHGWMAELLNHRSDILSGKDASIIGDDNAKNGADRLVDNIEIQSKYCASAQRSINAAFDENGFYKYRNQQIEVPKDQYSKALELMQEKIKQGKIEGVTDPAEAKNIVRKGHFTYEEARNASKFCTKESLKYDAYRGSIAAISAFGISFVCQVAILLYRNKNITLKDALKSSLFIASKSAFKSFSIAMISMQAQRIPLLKTFLEKMISFDFNGGTIGKSLAEFGGKNTANMSKSGINSAANNVLRSNAVIALATIAVQTAPDVYKMFRGNMSGSQVIKNLVVNSASTGGAMTGAIIGGMIGAVPGAIIGGLIGGFGASILGKKAMDNMIEDDVVRVYRVFFAQMERLVVLFSMNELEIQKFQNMVECTIQENNQNEFFKLIKPNKQECIAHINAILKPLAVIIVSARPKIPPQIFDSKNNQQLGLELLNDVASA
ncbi:hypothetical protein HCW_02535 [Helicobacter cetorum MIT 00-7128]|uniref:Uncharacterized protein n=2 Tax=Helicobacter cetorum TaxID=138563 RepID=I0ELG9_HELC0|nr:hypothetical protein HCW_02535 [Helicobacter cetorum MIT 00-7128]